MTLFYFNKKLVFLTLVEVKKRCVPVTCIIGPKSLDIWI